MTYEADGMEFPDGESFGDYIAAKKLAEE